jgi:hypothetical protein
MKNQALIIKLPISQNMMGETKNFDKEILTRIWNTVRKTLLFPQISEWH